MRYIVKVTIDRWPPGEDVTERYPAAVAQRLATEGYLEEVDDTPAPEPAPTDTEQDGE
jgi:hypothetical protein